jgi:hypothetical protein
MKHRIVLPIGAATLPLAVSAATLIAHVDAAQWLSMPDGLRQGLSRDVLLYTACAVIVAAPIAGVVTAGDVRARGRMRMFLLGSFAPLATAAAILVLASAAMLVAVWGASTAEGLAFVATSHATLFAVALALAALGALMASVFSDALDALACTLGVAIVASGVLLVSGHAVSRVPRPLLEAMFASSPLAAIATASQVDVVRLSVPYQMSGLAHLQLAYPAWDTLCVAYVGFAALCFVGERWKHGQR